MKNVIIGTAGHVDHGKTSLIKALTGIDADRLKEEKKRGITIELGFAHIEGPGGVQAGIIDVPGHERFIRNMLAGIGGIDMVLLVVAADEGVMPQTVEHLDIMRLLGIKRGIVAISKSDAAEPEWTDMVEADVREAVKGSFLESAPFVRVSSVTGEGIEELRSLIFREIEDIADKNSRPSLLRIPMDRVFTVQGFGTVITGTLVQGSICVGQDVQIYPEGRTAKVRSLQVHGKSVDAAFAGQRTAVNLAGVGRDAIERGNVLAFPGSMTVASMPAVMLSLLADSPKSVRSGSRLHLHYGSAQTLCKAVLLDRDELDPGESCFAQLRTEEPIAVKNGDPFVVRYYSPLITVGGGVILNAAAPKLRRKDEAALQALRARQEGRGAALLAQALKEDSASYPGAEKLFAQLGISEEEGLEQLNELLSCGAAVKLADNVYVHIDYLNKIKDEAFAVLDAYYSKNPLLSAMPREEFRSRLSTRVKAADSRGAERLLAHLTETGELVAKGASIAKAGYKVSYTKAQLRLMDEIASLYEAAGCECPDPEQVFSSAKDGAERRRLAEAMAADGRLVRIQGKFLMDAAALSGILSFIREKLDRDGSISLAELRDRLGTSRKYALMILEYCDNIKLTKLQDDRRVYHS